MDDQHAPPAPTNPADGDLRQHPDCPAERFPTLPAALDALLERRIRATLAGNPPTHERRAYPCGNCGGAHLIRPLADTQDDEHADTAA